MLIRERWVRPAVMDYADCVRCRSAPRRRRAARIKQRDFTRRGDSNLLLLLGLVRLLFASRIFYFFFPTFRISFSFLFISFGCTLDCNDVVLSSASCALYKTKKNKKEKDYIDEMTGWLKTTRKGGKQGRRALYCIAHW